MLSLWVAALLIPSYGAPGWQPSRGHLQIPIWPGTPPDDWPVKGQETSGIAKGSLVAGRPWTEVQCVSRPTITVYPPKGKSTGAAVLVFPGGGYSILAIDLEGTEVCNWLNSIGITGVLVKYRVPGEKGYPKPAPCSKSGHYPLSPIALDDAQRALGLVRFHAREWHVDPHKIGVIGFSAGGHLVAATSTHIKGRLYKPVDAADQVSCRPDFGIALYPGHLSFEPRPLELNPDIRVTKATPPTFIVQAKDDPVDTIKNSLVYYTALKKAHARVEYHLFPHGGHAFGLRPTKAPITKWPKLAERWLGTIDVIPNRSTQKRPRLSGVQ